MKTNNNNWYALAYEALLSTSPQEKINKTRQLYSYCEQNLLSRDGAAPTVKSIETAGRPQKPELVHPAKVKRRKLNSTTGRAALIHAIAHIEFNAINLALDAIYRFRDMPDRYYRDWLLVAFEEAKHFELLNQRLEQLGYFYGAMPAHNSLWEMAQKTDHDVLIRMALVPRVLEARGLDVTPSMIERLQQVDDNKTVDILKIILHDEVGHVAIGSRWFEYCCQQRQLDPILEFRSLLKQYQVGIVPHTFNVDARKQAGFSDKELCELEQYFHK